MCSARSRTRPCTSISPSIDGVSRTATAPGPKASITRPKRASSSARATKPRGVGLVEFDDLRDEQDLPRHAGLVDRRLHALVDDALMRGVLVDDDQPVAGLRHDIGLVHLRARGAERALDQFGRRLEAFDARIGGRLADVEGGLRGFGKTERGAPPRMRVAAIAARRPRRRAPPVVAAAARRAERAEGRDGGAAAGRWPRAGPRAPAPPSARARSARAPARRRGSALRSWPDAR